jgi:hypothetical protein
MTASVESAQISNPKNLDLNKEHPKNIQSTIFLDLRNAQYSCHQLQKQSYSQLAYTMLEKTIVTKICKKNVLVCCLTVSSLGPLKSPVQS